MDEVLENAAITMISAMLSLWPADADRQSRRQFAVVVEYSRF
jgi:hypothetical protein